MSEWKCVPLSEIALEIKSGYASGKHNTSGQGNLQFRPYNITKDGDVDLSEKKYVPLKSEEYFLKNEDIVFNNTNSPELLGKTCVIKSDTDYVYSNHLTRIRLKSGLNPNFFSKYLQFLKYRGFYQANCSNHVNQASIASNFLKNQVLVPVCSLPEQRAIVSKIEQLFSELDNGIANLKLAQKQLKVYRQAVLKQAFTGELSRKWREEHKDEIESASLILTQILQTRIKGKKFKKYREIDTTDLPELPVEWVWTKIRDVGHVQLGRQRAPKHHFGENMRPYLRVANVYEDRIDTSDVKEMNFSDYEFETFHLKFGDILLNEGQSKELVGRPAIFRDEIKNACFQNTLVRFRAFSGVLPEYALVVFLGYLNTGKFEKIARWTTNIAHLGAERFADLEFPLPPILEQKQIVVEVNRQLSIIQYMDNSITQACCRTGALRQSILKQAFEGKLLSEQELTAVRNDPEWEPAETLLAKIKSQPI